MATNPNWIKSGLRMNRKKSRSFRSSPRLSPRKIKNCLQEVLCLLVTETWTSIIDQRFTLNRTSQVKNTNLKGMLKNSLSNPKLIKRELLRITRGLTNV